PSAVRYADDYPMPAALSEAGIRAVVGAFRDAAIRALAAGFEVLEIHAAHGYLLQEFLSPLSNRRIDQYRGPFDNPVRILLEVVDAVRGVWPERSPLFVRISSTDWVEGGWTLDESVALAGRLGQHGVDLLDCSSGGNASAVRYPIGPGYQVPFAERLR